MFEYQSDYRRNGSGLHGRTFWFSVLTFVMLYAAAVIFMIAVILPMAFMDSAWALLWVIPVIFLLILFSLFILYPISIGVLRYFAKAYRQMDFGFKEVFGTFKKGNYSKVIKLGLIIIVSYVVLSFIFGMLMQFIFIAVNTPLTAMIESIGEGGGTAITGGQIWLLIGMMALNLVLVLLSYIPYILVAIYMFLAFMVYIDQPMIPTTDKLKIAWDVMFRAGGSLLKLIFSNFLLLLVPTVLYFVFIVIAVLMGMNSGNTALGAIVIVGTLLMFALYAAVLYFMTGSIVAYYFKCRDALDAKYAGDSADAVREPERQEIFDREVVDEDDLEPLGPDNR